MLKAKKIDILVSDIRMPGISGLELAEYIQKCAMDTAIVLLTGFSDFEYARTALRNGVEDYLLKPIRPKNILETISRVKDNLEKRRYQKNLVKQYETAVSSQDYQEQITWQFKGLQDQAMEILKDMARNYSEGISLNSLAEKYHFSVGYLSRMIKKETGYSFSEILNSIRLTAAVELLADETIKISHIGDCVGFSDQKYFSQVFKKTFGISPGEYRKQKEMQKFSFD